MLGTLATTGDLHISVSSQLGLTTAASLVTCSLPSPQPSTAEDGGEAGGRGGFPQRRSGEKRWARGREWAGERTASMEDELAVSKMVDDYMQVGGGRRR
jgi:hypothetical protein